MSSFLRTAFAAATLILATTSAQAIVATNVITVTSTNVGPLTLNQWTLGNYRTAGDGDATHTSTTMAAITNGQARSGNGSVAMSSTDSSGKADYVYTWGFSAGRTLGNLTALSFDWYRDGSSTSDTRLAPAMRLLYDADGNGNTTADQGYLIWEQVYNGATLSNQWVSSNIFTGNFWMRQFSPGNTVESFDNTLAAWKTGAHPSTVADLLSANTAILGIEFGIGSGWAGTFKGNVDNVTFGFANEGITTFNFETAAVTAVPEPGTLALVGLGLLGAGVLRRRQR